MEVSSYFKNNIAILFDSKRLSAFFSDIYQNDKSKVNSLMILYNNNIIDALMNSFSANNNVRNSFIKKLETEHAMRRDIAEWAVDTWICLIDNSIISKINEYKINQKEIATPNDMVIPICEKSNEDPFSTDDLLTKDDDTDYYINVHYNKKNGAIYIPCGVGKTDNGFFIYGIPETKTCNMKNANLFALTYNYLLRNSTISECDIPSFLINENDNTYINYRNIFRVTMIILQMIKNNYAISNNTININYNDNQEDLIYAEKLINHYCNLFSRLTKISYSNIKIDINSKGISVSLKGKIQGIYIENNNTPCNAREIWYGSKINYRLSDENLSDMTTILKEISSFEEFNEGQFETLKNMLSSRSHSVCIMPTGSGKSLIFYIASLLQPLPIFIIAPTEILITDQIRNLKKFHRIDNVSHLCLTEDNDFSKFEISTNINYLTPSTFQNRHLLSKFRYINNGTKIIDLKEVQVTPGPQISYIVLDEIHCLSSYGHDFRPEYLMLSKFLNKYLDRISFWGFTGTADYSVVEDIQNQLEIKQENIFSPLSFERYNISYNYIKVPDTEAMYTSTLEIVSKLVDRKERTIIFTKSKEISEILAEKIGYEADTFEENNLESYRLFAEQKCNVLIAHCGLGIGINLPNVKNIIHFGLPMSKNEYVQEIGRAGRANESISSYIIYLEPTESNVDSALLKRSTDSFDDVFEHNNKDNDYAHIYSNFYEYNTKAGLKNALNDICNKLLSLDRALTVESYEPKYEESAKRTLYILYCIGFLEDWYYYTSKNGKNEIMIIISATDHERFRKIDNLLERIRTKTSQYFDSVNAEREFHIRTMRAKFIDDIISTYTDWYYSNYIYRHKEIFLDMLDFIESNRLNNSNAITDSIKNYYTLPFVAIKDVEDRFSKMSVSKITDKVLSGFSEDTLANLERVLSKKYYYNIDYMLWFGNMRYNRFDSSRGYRILENADEGTKNLIVKALSGIYITCDVETRFEIIKWFYNNQYSFDLSPTMFITNIYKSAPRDLIYYGLISKPINLLFKNKEIKTNV